MYWAANIDAALAVHPLPSLCGRFVLVNIGVNEIGIEEASFKTNLAYILDALHAKWPLAQVVVDHIWKRGATAGCIEMNGWIDAVIADGRESWTMPGADETVWLEGGDDGATMTVDGTHYSIPAGQAEKAAQEKAAMGY